MLTDEKGNQVVIGNVRSLTAQAEEVMKADLLKSDLAYALEGIEIKVKKSGEDILNALGVKMRAYLSELIEVESKMNAKQELFPDYGINMPSKRVHGDGTTYESIYSANKFNETTSEETMRCVNEWSSLNYQLQGIQSDVKAAKAMMGMVDNKSMYPLRMKEYSILFG